MVKNTTTDKRHFPERGHSIRKPLDTGFPVRFSCGTGPDEESDCFQNAVRGLVNKGYLETEAKKTAEACFKALAKF